MTCIEEERVCIGELEPNHGHETIWLILVEGIAIRVRNRNKLVSLTKKS